MAFSKNNDLWRSIKTVNGYPTQTDRNKKVKFQE